MSNNELNTEMSGESLDISEQKKRELAQLFPSAFTESINKKGEQVKDLKLNADDLQELFAPLAG